MESATPEYFGKRMKQLGVSAISENIDIVFQYYSLRHPFNWSERQLRVYRSYCRQHLSVGQYPERMDGLNGGYVVYLVDGGAFPRRGGRETGPASGELLPTLPGTDAVYSLQGLMFNAALEGKMPAGTFAQVEHALLNLERIMSGTGFPAARLGNFHFRRGEYAQAASWYGTAARRGYVTGETLVRWSMCKLPPREAAALISRARTLCGSGVDAILADEESFLEAGRATNAESASTPVQ